MASLEKTKLHLGYIPLLDCAAILWADRQGYFEQAIALGVDAFVSGEISEPTVHLARESGVAYLACGHHATERYGVAALAAHLNAHCGLQCEFVDLDNPV